MSSLLGLAEASPKSPRLERSLQNLADVDVSVMQATNNEYGSDIYERVHQAPPPPPPEGAEGCAAELTSKSDDINHLCCPHGGCERGTPDTCSEECDTVWMPFSKRCSMWLESMGADSGAGASMAQVTAVLVHDAAAAATGTR